MSQSRESAGIDHVVEFEVLRHAQRLASLVALGDQSLESACRSRGSSIASSSRRNANRT
jgi:hypothetical protein